SRKAGSSEDGRPATNQALVGDFTVEHWSEAAKQGGRRGAVDSVLGFLGDCFDQRICFQPATSMDTSALNNPQLQQLINQEKERAMANEMIAKLTSACWDKCITGTPGSKFSSSESSCLSNCAQRYMDMSIMIVKRFQSMQ
ncbi:hypothetical protein R6Q59_033989, partial [Mikania micrantha]